MWIGKQKVSLKQLNNTLVCLGMLKLTMLWFPIKLHSELSELAMQPIARCRQRRTAAMMLLQDKHRFSTLSLANYGYPAHTHAVRQLFLSCMCMLWTFTFLSEAALLSSASFFAFSASFLAAYNETYCKLHFKIPMNSIPSCRTAELDWFQSHQPS